MGQRKRDSAAQAYARGNGYQESRVRAASDMKEAEFEGHRAHGTVTYKGITAGWLLFTCKCGENVFVPPS